MFFASIFKKSENLKTKLHDKDASYEQYKNFALDIQMAISLTAYDGFSKDILYRTVKIPSTLNAEKALKIVKKKCQTAEVRQGYKLSINLGYSYSHGKNSPRLSYTLKCNKKLYR